MNLRPIPSKVPAQSAIASHLSGAYFYDCYSTPVFDRSRSALAYFLSAFANTPAWVAALMSLRNQLARLAGLKDLGGLANFDKEKPGSDYRPGDSIGIFTLYSICESEALLGIRDKHLDVHLSVFKQAPTAAGMVTLSFTTVVHVHNWLGRLYMIPVAPLHKLIAPAVMSKLEVTPIAA